MVAGRTNEESVPPQKKCRMTPPPTEVADEMAVDAQKMLDHINSNDFVNPDRISNYFGRTTDEIMVIILFSFFYFYRLNFPMLEKG